jgi:hypothetical protein
MKDETYMAAKGSFTQAIWVGDFTERCDFNFSILIEIAIASEKY